VPKSKFTHCQKLELTTNKKMVTPAGSYLPAFFNVSFFKEKPQLGIGKLVLYQKRWI
jgi:hypothetical protein